MISDTARFKRVAIRCWVVLFCLALVVSGVAARPPEQGACTITGVVYRDYNSNGTQEPLEPGQPGVVVTAYNSQTARIGNVTSTASGAYNLTVNATGQVRIEFTGIPSYLYSGRFGSESDTTVTFVDCPGGAANVDLGLSQPSKYCHIANPTLGTSCYIFEDPVRGPFSTEPAFVTFPYTASGDQAHPTLALQEDIGTTFGLGYHRSSDSFFVASFMKRHAGFGPGATGAPSSGVIYRLRPSTGQVSLFLDLNTLGAAFNAGADPHPTAPVGACPPNFYNNCWQYDTASYDAVGKIGLGDLDISEDDQSIYVVNLFTRELIIIPIGYTATVPPAGSMTRIGLTGLPGLACPSQDDVRPFGLGTHDGRVYVGLVCTAQSGFSPLVPGTPPAPTRNPAPGVLASLRAYVYSFNPLIGASDFRQELVVPLDYPRSCADQAGDTPPCPNRSARWLPWIAGWPAPDAESTVYAQPWLTDIVFDNQNMILGFRDRFGDQTGHQQPGPYVLSDPALSNGITAGEMLRACRNAAGQWILESNGSCGANTTAGAGNNQGPGGGEYFFHDRNNPLVPAQGGLRHDEIVLGGLVNLPGTNEVATTAFDPLCENCGFSDPLFDGGVIWLDDTTGERTRSFRIYNGPNGVPPGTLIATFGKANGLGDLEAVCGPPNLEIGNRVWEDLDRNGVQDPGEQALVGVSLQLYMDTDGDGTTAETLIARTTTSATGEYYFNEANIFTAGLFPPTPGLNYVDINGNGNRDDFEPFGLLPDTYYEVRLDDPANYGGGPLTDYYITPTATIVINDLNDTSRDSNGVPTGASASRLQRVSATNYPVAALTTRLYGDNDHTYDFGFALTPVVQPTPGVPAPGDQPGAPGLAPASLGITKVVDIPFASPGETVTWTITVSNTGSSPASNVVVEDVVPSELEIVTVPSGAVVSGQTVRVTFSLIGPGQSSSVSLVTRVRSDVNVPFIIINPASIVGGPSAEARVLSVTRLPETGEPPLIRWVVIGLAVGGLLLALLAWFQRRGSAAR